MDFFHVIVVLLESTIRVSVPLIFAALAGLFTERAGVFDIGLEGKMLGAAFAAGAVAAVTQSVWMGLFAAILISIALSLVHGYASITQRGKQIVSPSPMPTAFARSRFWVRSIRTCSRAISF